MGENPGSKDKYLEALDFIINVLKEHEQTLDKSIDDLANVTEKMGEPGQLDSKLDKMNEKMNLLQKDLMNLISSLPNLGKPIAPAAVKEQVVNPATGIVVQDGGPPMVLNCKQWADFQTLSFQPQTISFIFKETEQLIQVDALKGNKIITYSGEFPKLSAILKTWLSRQLNVTEKNVLEGTLSIS